MATFGRVRTSPAAAPVLGNAAGREADAATLALDRSAKSKSAIGDAQFPTADGAVCRRADVIQVVRH